MESKTHTSSGLGPIDDFCGGYPRGGVCIARGLDREPDALQDFYVTQVKQHALDLGRTILVASLGMSSRELVHCIAYGESRNRLQKLEKASIYISDKERSMSLDKFLEVFSRTVKKINPDIAFIEGFDKIIPNGRLLQASSQLIDTAQDLDCPTVVIDFDYKIQSPYPRRGDTMELELKTTLEGIVEANIYEGPRQTTTADLYGRWRLFENILKK